MIDDILILKHSIKTLKTFLLSCEFYRNLHNDPNSTRTIEMNEEYKNAVKNLKYDQNLLDVYKNEYPEYFL